MVQVDRAKLAQLKRRINDLLARVQITHEDARRMSARSARIVRDEFLRAEAARNISSDVRADTFATDSANAPEKHSLTQLAGVRLRGRTRPWARNYREWHAATARTRLRWRGRGSQRRIVGGRTQLGGQLVGMSLAMMYHYGARKLPRNRFAPDAKRNARMRVYQQLEQDLRTLLFSGLGE